MALGDHGSARDTAAPSRNLRRVGLICVMAAAAIAGFGIFQRRSQEAEVAGWTRERAVPSVAAITPKLGAASQRLVLPGTVQAWYEAPIYARVPGYLKMWNFDYGAHVKKGDVLAEIETPDLDAQLAAALAKLNSAKALVKVREAEQQFTESTYERWRDSPKGVVSVQEREAKQADYNSALARLNALLHARRRTRRSGQSGDRHSRGAGAKQDAAACSLLARRSGKDGDCEGLTQDTGR